MQSFLTSRSYKETAQHLDTKRLQEQRVECIQIYNCVIGQRLDVITDEIKGPAVGYMNHPAVRMWRSYPHALLLYAWYISRECDARGINDHRAVRYFFERRMDRHPFIIPHWWADEHKRDRIIYTHRCNLIRKDVSHYRPLFPDITIDEAFRVDYEWPVT